MRNRDLQIHMNDEALYYETNDPQVFRNHENIEEKKKMRTAVSDVIVNLITQNIFMFNSKIHKFPIPSLDIPNLKTKRRYFSTK